jgi:hypothetical protein
MLYDEWKEQFCEGREVEWLCVYDSDCSDRDVFDKIPTWSDDSEYSDSQCSDSQGSQDSDSDRTADSGRNVEQSLSVYDLDC